MTKFLSPDEVAKIMGVTRDTVYSMISRKQLDSYQFGRSRRITPEQIEACLNRKYQRPIDATKPNANLIQSQILYQPIKEYDLANIFNT